MAAGTFNRCHTPPGLAHLPIQPANRQIRLPRVRPRPLCLAGVVKAPALVHQVNCIAPLLRLGRSSEPAPTSTSSTSQSGRIAQGPVRRRLAPPPAKPALVHQVNCIAPLHRLGRSSEPTPTSASSPAQSGRVAQGPVRRRLALPPATPSSRRRSPRHERRLLQLSARLRPHPRPDPPNLHRRAKSHSRLTPLRLLPLRCSRTSRAAVPHLIKRDCGCNF
ncbi:hypothetical protein VPH35_137662 [Triticum aestivum]|uniref:uncharacterized protein n=1 Tax=Triticum aestivum TaxID=4565 RepID=UPI001D0291ED|nr:uncharacterized protein LOC123167074 [Triticum aestivum]